MKSLRIFQNLLWLAIPAFLIACGGGETNTIAGTPDPAEEPAAPAAGQNSVAVTPVPALGFRDPTTGTFSDGVIDTTVSSIGSGGTVGLTVHVVDTANQNAFITDAGDVTFSANCGATFSPDAAASTANGIATADFQANGCEGNVQITATLASLNLSAQASINVQPAVLGSIQFVSATPEVIRLKGAGGNQSSRVVFRVVDQGGGALTNRKVFFTLDTNVGGISLVDASAVTSGDGTATAIVQSGTVHTAVRVTATTCNAADPANTTQAVAVCDADASRINTVSERLVISTAIADQNSFSLSASCFNVEGLDIDGKEVSLTVRAADRFNNPVPDGTTIAFTAEGGRVQPDCQTVNGNCSVTWNSQDPRPGNGRSTILATALGEESFLDVNGDGLFDGGDIFNDPARDPEGFFLDLAEAYIDRNEGTNAEVPFCDPEISGDNQCDNASRIHVSGRSANTPGSDPNFDSNSEFPVDVNNNGVRDAGDGRFTGLLCDNPAICSSATTLNVRESIVLIMSASVPRLADGDLLIDGVACEIDGVAPFLPACRINFGAKNETHFISLTARDRNDQPLPAATTLTAASDLGAVGIPETRTVLCTSNDSVAANTFGFSVKGPNGTDADSGTMTITITSPDDIQSIVSIGLSYPGFP